MPPKPFPSKVRIGVDICHVERIKNVIQRYQGTRLERWGRKVFGRLEWPAFTRNCRSLPVHNLAQWIAGRWAAKEAAIKAHSNRQLSRRDISILSTVTELGDPTGASLKPLILIDPPTKNLFMDEAIARRRCISTAPEYLVHKRSRELERAFLEAGSVAAGGKIYQRRALVREEDRRLADLSISHDGSYAVAVCMALDETHDLPKEITVDNGEGDPVHEPEWGDLGFLPPAEVGTTDSHPKADC